MKGLSSLVHAATEVPTSVSFSATDPSLALCPAAAEDAVSGVDDSATPKARDESVEDSHSEQRVFEFEVDGMLASPNKGAEVDPRIMLEGGHVTLSQD